MWGKIVNNIRDLYDKNGKFEYKLNINSFEYKWIWDDGKYRDIR